MNQTMRTRSTGLARCLVALWFVLFPACAFSHAHAVTRPVSAEAGVLSSLLEGTPCQAHDASGGAPGEVCNALAHAPLSLTLLLLLGLAVLLGMARVFNLLLGTTRRSALCPPWSGLTPGRPVSVRKRLQRYNE